MKPRSEPRLIRESVDTYDGHEIRCKEFEVDVLFVRYEDSTFVEFEVCGEEECLICGQPIRDATAFVHEWSEPRGEYWGAPCSEDMAEVICTDCAKAEGIQEGVDRWYEEEEVK